MSPEQNDFPYSTADAIDAIVGQTSPVWSAKQLADHLARRIGYAAVALSHALNVIAGRVPVDGLNKVLHDMRLKPIPDRISAKKPAWRPGSNGPQITLPQFDHEDAEDGVKLVVEYAGLVNEPDLFVGVAMFRDEDRNDEGFVTALGMADAVELRRVLGRLIQFQTENRQREAT